LTACLFLALWIAPGCGGVDEKNRQADKTADMVLKLLAAEESDSLYDNYTTESFRRANSAETLQKLARALVLYLGEPETHSLVEYRLKTVNGNTSGLYLYKVQWTKADGTLKLKLQWENGAWKVRTLDIQSSALGTGAKTRPVNKGKTIQI
jgi:hypothetical protein